MTYNLILNYGVAGIRNPENSLKSICLYYIVFLYLYLIFYIYLYIFIFMGSKSVGKTFQKDILYFSGK